MTSPFDAAQDVAESVRIAVDKYNSAVSVANNILGDADREFYQEINGLDVIVTDHVTGPSGDGIAVEFGEARISDDNIYQDRVPRRTIKNLEFRAKL